MKELKEKLDSDEAAAWKARYHRRTMLIESMTSLLNKYASSFDLANLYRRFLLTLTGQFLVESSRYLALDKASDTFVLSAHYGRGYADEAPAFDAQAPLMQHLQQAPGACRTASLPPALTSDKPTRALVQMTSLLAPLRLKGETIGVIGLGSRITKQPFLDSDLEIVSALCAVSAVFFNNTRLFENARASMEETRALSDLRTEMISRITHEFRTPLTVIAGGMGIIDVSEDSAPIRDSILASVSDLEKLIGSLLKLRSDVHVVHKGQRFHPGRALAELLPLIKAGSDKGITFAVTDRVQNAVMLRRIGREAFLTIVDVLVENAVKFSGADSRVDFTLETVNAFGADVTDGKHVYEWEQQAQRKLDADDDVKQTVDDDGAMQSSVTCLVLRVEDRGIGIPADEVRYLGEPFRQASNSPDQSVKGKALGLAVVLKMLSECGGELWCRSDEGVGTTFSVYLPLV